MGDTLAGMIAAFAGQFKSSSLFAVSYTHLDVYKRQHLVFGRVVTAQSARGQGLGGKLIREILQLCAEKWAGKEIKIEAQEQVVELYEKYGFEAVGQPFIFESTPHLTMEMCIRDRC